MNAKMAPRTALEERTTSAVWEVVDTDGYKGQWRECKTDPKLQHTRQVSTRLISRTCIQKYPVVCVCVANQVCPGTCWWWWWCWWGPSCWSSPKWCSHSRCPVPEIFASDALCTPRAAAHRCTWCCVPECSWGLTRWYRLKWGCCG